MTITVAFYTTATLGQENSPWADMIGSSADGVTDSLVVGSTVPYYVEPDPAVNPSYTGPYDPGSDNATQNINSTFSWAEDGSAASVIFNAPAADANAPYRTVQFTAAGDFIINATETGPGGCPDPTPTQENVTVIPVPTFTASTTAYEVCDGATQTLMIDDIAASLNTSGNGWSNYYFRLDVQKDNLAADGSTWNNQYTHTDTVATVTTTSGKGVPADEPVDILEGANAAGDVFLAWDDAGTRRITRYTYTIKGFNHHISRKADFLNLPDAGNNKTKQTFSDADFDDEDGGGAADNDGYVNNDVTLYTWYKSDGSTGGANTSITVTVYPVPETGNIYNVPNNFEF